MTVAVREAGPARSAVGPGPATRSGPLAGAGVTEGFDKMMERGLGQ